MTRQQWRTLKILCAYALWWCDFLVWRSGMLDKIEPRWETGLYLLIYLIGLLIITIT